MKTTHGHEKIKALLKTIEYAQSDSLGSLTEGHSSQAFSFKTLDGKKLVLRIAASKADFAADSYAAKVFGPALKVPQIVDIGEFDESSFYCISEMASGKTTNILTDDELAQAIPAIRRSLADIYL